MDKETRELVDDLKSPNWKLVEMAFVRLSDLQDPATIPAMLTVMTRLSEAIESDLVDVEDFNDSLAGMIHSMGAKALPPLEKALHDDNPLIRSSALWLVAWEITDVPVRKNVDLVASALRDEDAEVRSYALFCLEQMIVPEARAAIDEWRKEAR
jgi:HEAT repeat protein